MHVLDLTHLLVARAFGLEEARKRRLKRRLDGLQDQEKLNDALNRQREWQSYAEKTAFDDDRD
jgi:hypothetical protein